MVYVELFDSLTATQGLLHGRIFLEAIPRVGEHIYSVDGKLLQVTHVLYMATNSHMSGDIRPQPFVRLVVTMSKT